MALADTNLVNGSKSRSLLFLFF